MKSVCDNCGHVDKDLRLEDVPDLAERLDPGGVIPAGECTRCGCFSYPYAKDLHILRKSRRERGHP